MAKRNAFIAVIIIISLVCMLPTFIERIGYESNHNSFEVAPVLTADTTKEELVAFKENGINLVLTDETDSEFDEEKIRYAKDLGLDIAIRINVGEKPNNDFEEKLDRIVKENDVKYMLIAQNEDFQTYDAPLENVIEKNNMTVVVCEKIKQLSNEMPKGYDRYIKASGGKLMRCYTTLKNPARSLNSSISPKSLGDILYHHMSNSLKDRNTEFIALNVIKNDALSRDDAIKSTIYAANKFKEKAENLGYVQGKDVTLDGYVGNLRVCVAASFMLSVIMIMAAIEIFMKKRTPTLEWALCILALLVFGASFVMPQSLLYLAPTAFAPICALFSFTVFVQTTKYVKLKKFSFLISELIAVVSSLSVLLIGASFMSAMLSGTDYYLNNLIFRGVKLSLILPILYALVFMWLYESNSMKLSSEKIKSGFSKIKLSHIIILGVVTIAAFIYVLRSGNAKISPLENSLRNFIADLAGTRPRTKEFLIGWPLLALSVYFIHIDAPKLLTWASFSGSSVLFASVTNTFCHVFADFSTSLVRTLNGLLFSVPIIIILLLLAHLFKKLFLKNNSL